MLEDEYGRLERVQIELKVAEAEAVELEENVLLRVLELLHKCIHT